MFEGSQEAKLRGTSKTAGDNPDESGRSQIGTALMMRAIGVSQWEWTKGSDHANGSETPNHPEVRIAR